MNFKNVDYNCLECNAVFLFVVLSHARKSILILLFSDIYIHLPLTSLRWTILDQLALYTDEGQLIARRCR